MQLPLSTSVVAINLIREGYFSLDKSLSKLMYSSQAKL